MGRTEPVGQRHSVYLLAASFFGVTRMLLLRWHFALFATAVSHVHAEQATTRHRHGPTDGRGSVCVCVLEGRTEKEETKVATLYVLTMLCVSRI